MTFVKDPGSTSLDYTVSWTTYLSTGETIATSTWAASSTSISFNSMSATTVAATVWVKGGTVGEVVRLTNSITTNSVPARSDQRHVIVRIEYR